MTAGQLVVSVDHLILIHLSTHMGTETTQGSVFPLSLIQHKVRRESLNGDEGRWKIVSSHPYFSHVL